MSYWAAEGPLHRFVIWRSTSEWRKGSEQLNGIRTEMMMSLISLEYLDLHFPYRRYQKKISFSFCLEIPKQFNFG